jgi:hypothetical protein
MNASAPVPAFHAITNAVVNEYCFVERESASSNLPSLDPVRYLGAMARETRRLEDPALRKRMRSMLVAHGWRRVRFRYLAARIADAFSLAAAMPVPFVRGVIRLATGPALGPLKSHIARDRHEFGNQDEALAYVLGHERPYVRTHLHLLPLIQPAGNSREVQRTGNELLDPRS